ncbi:hypothetical protein [Stappia indica]|uniref:Uncharacterized protein n=1 Tax=Stappia indica TaxID=538381 RepID=A0A857C5P4_9HYPH|nr:hypothetical protein [Stappia indica]QGZ34346.1 hypothetical protein GH266_07390 [Stappia indica]
MRLALHSPFGAFCKALCLSAAIYAVSGPSLAPYRPDIVDLPLSRYHQAVNELISDQTPMLAMVTDPLKASPHIVRQKIDGMLRR